MNITDVITLSSGHHIPIIGLGTWELTEDTSDIVAEALGLGYPMIDTSGDYGTQPGIARGLKESGLERKDVYIVTKVEENDDAYSAVVRNLQELELAYSDLVLIHRPPTSDYESEILWRGLIRARNDGLTRDIGVSNYSEEQIQLLADATGIMPAVNQIEWTPFGWSIDMYEFSQENGIILQAYSPLTRSTRMNDGTLQTIADKYGKSPAQIMLRWCLQIGVIPLPKANQLHHLEDNIDIFDFTLEEEDMEELSDLNENYSALSESPIYLHQHY